MPVSALIVTLADGPAGVEAARALAADARFCVGAPEGRRLPVALDTPDRRADADAWDWLRARPGVEFVDLVLVHLEDAPPAPVPPASAARLEAP